MKFFVVVLLVLVTLKITAQDEVVTGIVFFDKNQDGIFNKGDKPLKSIAVSNQRDVVLTDEKGKYSLPLLNGQFIYVVKPSGFQVQFSDNNIPLSYYYHKPKGTPKYLKYKGVSATGNPPKEINFPVNESNEKEPFKMLAIGDPQTPHDESLNYFRDGSVNDMMRHDASFYIVLGDIADDNLNIYKREKEIMSTLYMPGYHVPGNHDVNYRAHDKTNQNETFKKEFGPDYYSFNYGDVHFVVLNNILYQGWNKDENKKGRYFGGMNTTQLEWLKNDLSVVPEDQLVVINSHIPFLEQFIQKESILQFHSLLKSRKKVLSLSGHLHTVNAYWNDSTTHWGYDTPHEGVIAGAACGSWWSEPKNENGVPVATCMDGSPKGYFVFEFAGANYQYEFIPIHNSDDFQIRISSPKGNVEQDELSNTWVIANWFVGKPNQKVMVSIDNGEEIEMTNYFGKDPFMEQTSYLRKNKKSWSPSVAKTHHLWKCKLLGNLEKGCHRITVTAYGENGKIYKAYQVLEVN